MTEPLTNSEIEFHFEKGALFRVISVDGTFGGVSPASGKIHMSVYNERQPLPKKVTHSLGSSGDLGPELVEKRVVRSGLFREVEADLVMDLDVALAVRSWLDTKIKEAQDLAELKLKLLEELQKKAGS